MNRIEYTDKITRLLRMMIDEGEHPIGDSWHRLDEEQQYLYSIGRDKDGNIIGKTVTNCDGIHNISAHQRGKALDILFLSDDGTKLLPGPKKGWKYWHDKWEEMGGQDDISWDEDHFEGR